MSKIEELAHAVEIGKSKLVPGLVQEALDEGNAPIDILNKGMIDAMAIVGDKFKRNEIFVPEMLIGVSGIGPKGALGILSTIAPNQFRLAVLSGDSKTISKSPGIGPKTAQKLIIELKDKMKIEDVFEDDIPADLNGSDYDQDAGKEAVMALVSLGYSESEAFAALKKITLTPDMDSETILKLALKKMLTF